MKSVYSAVQTGSLNKAACASSVKGLRKVRYVIVECSDGLSLCISNYLYCVYLVIYLTNQLDCHIWKLCFL